MGAGVLRRAWSNFHWAPVRRCRGTPPNSRGVWDRRLVQPSQIAPPAAQLPIFPRTNVPSIMSQQTYKNVVGPKIRSMRIQLSWTQEASAKCLQRMGWNISRSTLAKVEARLIHVSDSDLLYFVRLFEVEPNYLLPEIDPEESVGTAVRRLLLRPCAA